MSQIIRPKSRAKDLINKFKSRQKESGIQQALVFLKLKQHNCPTRQALIFSKKKQKNVDGTLEKDGPANCRKLNVYKPDGIIVNGWLKGQKLKYKETTSFNHFSRHSSASLSTKINQINKQSRQTQQQERRQRSQSLFWVDTRQNPKENIQKIAALKDKVMKEREISPFVFKLKGLQLPQMTKIFSQQISKVDSNGIVVKSGAFQNCINNSQVEYVATDENSFGKSSKNARDTVQTTILDKRNDILNYKKLLEQIMNDEQINNSRTQSPKKLSKTLNLSRSLLKKAKSTKLIRSKSAMKQNEIKSFEDKISLVLRRQFSSNFNNLRRDFHRINDSNKKLKLAV